VPELFTWGAAARGPGNWHFADGPRTRPISVGSSCSRTTPGGAWPHAAILSGCAPAENRQNGGSSAHRLVLQLIAGGLTGFQLITRPGHVQARPSSGGIGFVQLRRNSSGQQLAGPLRVSHLATIPAMLPCFPPTGEQPMRFSPAGWWRCACARDVSVKRRQMAGSGVSGGSSLLARRAAPLTAQQSRW